MTVYEFIELVLYCMGPFFFVCLMVAVERLWTRNRPTRCGTVQYKHNPECPLCWPQGRPK